MSRSPEMLLPNFANALARLPGFRALTWDHDWLYASRGYKLLRARVQDPANLNWEYVADCRPTWKRRLSVTNRLGARLFRDGFHALAVLPSGALVAAVPGAILTLAPGETNFRQTHAIIRGTRPLHITTVPSGTVYWGEYFDNAARDEVHIYGSTDQGQTWSVATRSPKAPSDIFTTSFTTPGETASGSSPATMATNAVSCAPLAISAVSKSYCRANSRPALWPPCRSRMHSTSPPILHSSRTTSTALIAKERCRSSQRSAVLRSMGVAYTATFSSPP